MHDPLAAVLAERLARMQSAGSVTDGGGAFAAYAPVFGDLGTEPRFVAAVARQLQSLQRRGVLATLESLS